MVWQEWPQLGEDLGTSRNDEDILRGRIICEKKLRHDHRLRLAVLSNIVPRRPCFPKVRTWPLTIKRQVESKRLPLLWVGILQGWGQPHFWQRRWGPRHIAGEGMAASTVPSAGTPTKFISYFLLDGVTQKQETSTCPPTYIHISEWRQTLSHSRFLNKIKPCTKNFYPNLKD